MWSTRVDEVHEGGKTRYQGKIIFGANTIYEGSTVTKEEGAGQAIVVAEREFAGVVRSLLAVLPPTLDPMAAMRDGGV